MELTVHVESNDDDAVDDPRGVADEILQRILHDVWNQDSGRILDANGNSIGYWALVYDEDDDD